MQDQQKTCKGKVIVIGAGIAGLSSAFYLVQDGWEVSILERGDGEDNCSYGNAGMIVPSHFTPLAAPGVVSQGIRWMFDSKSPFYVKPSFRGNMISWGLKFLKHANHKRVKQSAPGLRDLHLASSHLYTEWDQMDGFEFGLNQNGILMLFKTDKVGEEETELAYRARELGLNVDVLDQAQIQALEPFTELNVLGGAHYRCDRHLDPTKLMGQLRRYLEAHGVHMHTECKVERMEIEGGSIKALIANGQQFSADKFVMTGGAWLPQLAAQAGLKIPIMPGKGYSFMYTPGQLDQRLEHAALLLEARVAVTPMKGQIRFGGTMELASFNNKVNMNRVEGIVRSIPNYLPDFKVQLPPVQDIWYGYRPCSPDGLPYLGKAKGLDNLLIAGGAGMMGLSLGPIFGKVIAQLAAEEHVTVNIEAYCPYRFN